MRCSGRTASPSTCQPRTACLPGGRLGEAALTSRWRLHRPGQLGGRGHVTAQHAAGDQRGRGRGATPMARACPVRSGRNYPVADQPHHPAGHQFRIRPRGQRDSSARSPTEPPGRVRAAEEALTFSRAISAKSGPPLVGDQQPVLADGAQQPAGQRAGARARLQHPGAGEDVRHGHDLGRVLGVDHGRAARHGQREIGQQRPQRDVARCRPRTVTTLPSGAPISSSCATPPRWVWKTWPGCSTSRCLRPLGSVS